MSDGRQKTEDREPEVGAEAQAVTSPSASDIRISTLDKIKRFFFSKEEWEAYLLERLEEKTKKEGREARDMPDHQNVLSWIKTVFNSPEEEMAFLDQQLQKLQKNKEK